MNQFEILNPRAIARSRQSEIHHFSSLHESPFHCRPRWSSILPKIWVPYFLVGYSHRCKQKSTSLLLLLPILHRLSGFVVIQVVVYFKLYQQDPGLLKGLVRYPQLFIYLPFSDTRVWQVVIVWYNQCIVNPSSMSLNFFPGYSILVIRLASGWRSGMTW